MESFEIKEGRIGQMERRRRQILSRFMVAFALWEILSFLSATVWFVGLNKGILVFLSLVAWGVWGFYLVQILRFGRKLIDEPATARALGDERWVQNRLKALAVGFVAVLIAQAALIALYLAVPFEAMIAARVTISVGVITFIAAFLRYDRE